MESLRLPKRLKNKVVVALLSALSLIGTDCSNTAQRPTNDEYNINKTIIHVENGKRCISINGTNYPIIVKDGIEYIQYDDGKEYRLCRSARVSKDGNIKYVPIGDN